LIKAELAAYPIHLAPGEVKEGDSIKGRISAKSAEKKMKLHTRAGGFMLKIHSCRELPQDEAIK
jgi:hypothetical protein